VHSRIPVVVRSNRFGFLLGPLALNMQSEGHPHAVEERAEPMSSDPELDDEQLEVDDETRRPQAAERSGAGPRIIHHDPPHLRERRVVDDTNP
jgi:hypothetical protein